MSPRFEEDDCHRIVRISYRRDKANTVTKHPIPVTRKDATERRRIVVKRTRPLFGIGSRMTHTLICPLRPDRFPLYQTLFS